LQSLIQETAISTMAPNDYDDFDEEEEEEEVEEEEEEVVQKKQKRTKKWKDPNKPKRAMSAFFLYSQANRPRVKEENPDVSFGQVVSPLSICRTSISSHFGYFCF